MIDSFILANNCDYTKNIISNELLESIQQQLNVRFGEQLKKYLLKYGYLGYKYIELYGMNSNQGLNSDLFKKTKYLNEYFEITKGYVALENLDEHHYCLIDSNDNIYIYDTLNNNLKSKNMKMFDYIIKRFSEVE